MSLLKKVFICCIVAVMMTGHFSLNAQTTWENDGTSTKIYADPTTAKVGVGTTNPEEMLHVHLDDPNNPTRMLISGERLTTTAEQQARNNQPVEEILFGLRTSDNHTTNVRAAIRALQGSNDQDSRHLAFYLGSNSSGSAPTERFRIHKDGHFGFNTATPTPTVNGPVMHLYAAFAGDDAEVRIESKNSGKAVLNLDAPNSYGEIRTPSGTDLHINSGGNVGIGTSAPRGKLEISGGDTWLSGYQKSLALGNQGAIFFDPAQSTGTEDFYFGMSANNGSLRIFKTFEAGPGSGQLTDLMNFDVVSGNIGIGESNPQHKLHVVGTVRANEIIVEAENGPDYVFADDYELMPVAEVAEFVQKNKHLPGIAPAREMQENGLGIGEFQLKLLEKVEELTLYVIELKKKNLALQERINTMEAGK